MNALPPLLDAGRIAVLAQALDLSPREMLALAACIASARQPAAPLDRAHLAGKIACLRHAAQPAQAATTLLLLGYGAYALDAAERALVLAWQRGAGDGA